MPDKSVTLGVSHSVIWGKHLSRAAAFAHIQAVLTAVVLCFCLAGYGGNQTTSNAGGPPVEGSTSDGSANVVQFGAVCDGVADDAPAIRAALRTGRDVFLPACAHPYLIASYDPAVWKGNIFMFHLQSGQTVQGETGTMLKVADGVLNTPLAAAGGSIFFIDRKAHVTISNIAIDMNGAHNLTPAGGFHPAIALRFEGGSYNTVDSVRVKDSPGLNDVMNSGLLFGNASDHFSVRNSTFVNGGTSLPGNVHQNDFSAIYVQATDSVIQNNRILNDFYPKTVANNGGIEVHGSRTIVQGNNIDKCYPAIYVGTNIAGQDLDDVAITDNRITNSLVALIFVPAGLKPAPDDFHRIKFNFNQVTLKSFPGFEIIPWAVSQQRSDNGLFDYRGTIYDSEFDDNVVTDADQPGGHFASSFLRLSSARHVVALRNVIHNVGGPAFQIIGSPYASQDLRIEHNTIRDFNASRGLSIMAVALDLSGPPQWRPEQQYAPQTYVRPSVGNHRLYFAVGKGVSGTAEPQWPQNIGDQVADGSMVWQCAPAYDISDLSVQNNMVMQTVGGTSYSLLWVSFDPGFCSVTNTLLRSNTLVNIGSTVSGPSAKYLVP